MPEDPNPNHLKSLLFFSPLQTWSQTDWRSTSDEPLDHYHEQQHTRRAGDSSYIRLKENLILGLTTLNPNDTRLAAFNLGSRGIVRPGDLINLTLQILITSHYTQCWLCLTTNVLRLHPDARSTHKMPPIKPPPRWTARSLTAMFMPHMFRNARHPQESTGVRKEKVPLDADQHQQYIKRKREKLTKAICHDFKLNLEIPATVPKRHWWSVATGEWVPKHYLKLDTFFPYSLGPQVAQEVSRRIQFTASHNGMLLPPAVWGPYNDVSIATEAEASEFLSRKDCRHPSWCCRVPALAWPPHIFGTLRPITQRRRTNRMVYSGVLP